jgi:tetratricopeptide (TPR) repeat protein
MFTRSIMQPVRAMRNRCGSFCWIFFGLEVAANAAGGQAGSTWRGEKVPASWSFAAWRECCGHAFVGLNKPADAMSDLNYVLNLRPNLSDALALRGIVWSAMTDYGKARDDLDRAILQKETVESYFARAKIFEAQNNPKKATDDYRRATRLTPAGVFDVLAQAESKRKIQELSKRLPCGGSGQTGTCL